MTAVCFTPVIARDLKKGGVVFSLVVKYLFTDRQKTAEPNDWPIMCAF
jgi:hypothetical protein